MELVFSKTERGYESEFIAHSPYRLHIEGEGDIVAVLYKKSVSEGKYSIEKNISGIGIVYDEEFPEVVFPKYVKVVMAKAVKNCYVNFKAASEEDLTALEKMVEENRQELERQGKINDEQQKQIDANTQVNNEQEEHLDSMVPMSDDKLQSIIGNIKD